MAGLNISNVEIEIKSQTIGFALYGECWVPKKYSSFILFKDNYSLEKTEEYDCHRVVEEKDAERRYHLPLSFFNEGIEMEIV